MIKAFTTLIIWLFNKLEINILLPLQRKEFKGQILIEEQVYHLHFIVNTFFGEFLDSEEIVINDVVLEVVLDFLHLGVEVLDN